MAARHVEETSVEESGKRRKILVVGKESGFCEDTMNYAVHLAERLGYDLLALSVDTSWRGEAFRRQVEPVAGDFKRKAAESRVHFEHLLKVGEIASAVEELQQEIRRIELVVTDSGVSQDIIPAEVTVPLFSVVSNTFNGKGGRGMASESSLQKKKPVGKVIGYGVATVALYAAVFMNADTVMQYFTRGGWYAALPIATVFVFSFTHGAFASHLWSLLGVEALKKDSLRQTEQKVVQQRKQARKRPRLQAYVNPFHRI